MLPQCHRMSNFQSSRSVLSALQCPAIFRLRSMWAYITKKHSSKYQTFEFLCRLYRDPQGQFPIKDHGISMSSSVHGISMSSSVHGISMSSMYTIHMPLNFNPTK